MDSQEFGNRFEEAERLAERLDRALIHYDEIQLALITSLLELKLAAPRQYAVFVMREIHGLGVPQICRALRVSREVVDKNMSRARRRLRQSLSQYPEIRSWLRATGRVMEAGSGAGSGPEGAKPSE